MSRKKLVSLIIIVFAVGIAVGCGIGVLIANVSSVSDTYNLTGTIVDNYGKTLIDEDGNEFEVDDTRQDGIVYNMCVFERRNEEISSTRDWYGPYDTVQKGLYEVGRALLRDEGFHEIYVYKTVQAKDQMTFVGRTYLVIDGAWE